MGMTELRRWHEATRGEAGDAATGLDQVLPSTPADRTNSEGPPDRPGLSDSYRDDPDDIFDLGEDPNGSMRRPDEEPEDGAEDATAVPADAETTDDADHGQPESLVDRPALPGDVAVHYGMDLTERNGHLARPETFHGEPTREQAVQGGLGDCGVIAALGAVAGHRPEAVRDLIEPRQDGSHLVRLHDVRQSSPGVWEPTGRRIELAVTSDLPVSDTYPHYAAFANTYHTGVAWAAVLEKALAGSDAIWPPDRAAHSTHRGYDRLHQGTYPPDRTELLALLTGQPAATYAVDTTPGNEPAVERWLGERLDARSPILVGTNSGDRYGLLPNRLVPSHAYEVVAASQGRITLHNPWGDRHPPPMHVRDFLDNIVPFVSTLRDQEENL